MTGGMTNLSIQVFEVRWKNLPKGVCKSFLRNFAIFTGKHLCQISFLIKEALAKVFSCEFCKISKNTFSHRTPPVVVSVRWNDHLVNYFSLMHRCENNGNLFLLTFSCAKF